MSSAGKTEARGFTLVELLVVLAIMSLSATLVFGVNFRQRDKAIIRDFGVSLGGYLQLSRSMALTKGVTARCLLDPVKGQVSSPLVNKSLAVPVGLKVRIGGPGEAPAEEVVLMEYYMDGSSSGGDIDLEYGEYTAQVSIDPLLGQTMYRF